MTKSCSSASTSISSLYFAGTHDKYPLRFDHYDKVSCDIWYFVITTIIIMAKYGDSKIITLAKCSYQQPLKFIHDIKGSWLIRNSHFSEILFSDFFQLQSEHTPYDYINYIHNGQSWVPIFRPLQLTHMNNHCNYLMKSRPVNTYEQSLRFDHYNARMMT